MLLTWNSVNANMANKVWGGIICILINFNGVTREWMSNVTPQAYFNVWNYVSTLWLTLIDVNKRAHVWRFHLKKKSDLAEKFKYVLTCGMHGHLINLFTLLVAINTCTSQCVQSCVNCFICMGLLSFVALQTFWTLVTHLEILCEAWERKSAELKKIFTNEEHDRIFHAAQFAFNWPLDEKHCSTLKVRILNYFQSLHMGCQVRFSASKACTSQINSTKYNFDFIFDVVNIQNT